MKEPTGRTVKLLSSWRYLLLVLLVAGLFFLLRSVRAEVPSFGVRVALEPGGFQDIAAGDLNADGFIDLAGVRGEFGGRNLVFLNNREGGFGAKELRREWGTYSGDLRTLALGDVTGDGSPDLVAARPAGRVEVYANDGQAGFSRAEYVNLLDTQAITALSLGDFTSDGALDILVAGPDHLLRNDGAGKFSDLGDFACAAGPVSALALGDLNDDGFLDIAAGLDGQNLILFGNGQGTFPARLPFGPPGGGTSGLLLLDLDNDGRLDLVTAEGTSYLNRLAEIPLSGGPCRTLEPGGATGQFEPENRRRFFAAHTLAAGDMDGDGRVDVITARDGSQNRIYLNLPDLNTSWYSSALRFGTGGDRTAKVLAVDLNRDAYLDLVTIDKDRADAVYMNDGAGQFPPGLELEPGPITPEGAEGAAAEAHPGGEIQGLALADLNGDGRMDIVTARRNAPGRTGELYLSRQGSAGFDTQPYGEPSDARTVLLADVDNRDGLDLVVGRFGAPNAVYLNSGGGVFTTEPVLFGLPGNQTRALAAGDLDRDGDLDLVAGLSGSGASRIFFNAGGGIFTPTLPLGQYRAGGSDAGIKPPTSVTDVTLGDLDGDGDLDAVVARAIEGLRGLENYIYLNDGEGGFGRAGSQSVFGTGQDTTQSVALGDVDGDGDLDIVAGNAWAFRQNAVYLNDGAANFRWPGGERPFGDAIDNTRQVALADIDGDGDLDIAVANERWKSFSCGAACPADLEDDEEQFSAVYINDGLGQFTTRRTLGTPYSDLRAIGFGDLDGDGALDLVAGQSDPLQPPRRAPLSETAGGASEPNPYGLARAVAYPNPIRRPAGLANLPPAIVITGPEILTRGGSLAPTDTFTGNELTISFRLSDPEGDPVAFVRTCYSLDGGANWRPAVQPGAPPIDRELLVELPGGCPYLAASPGAAVSGPALFEAAPGGSSHEFTWDLFASGFFGQSDRVVFRLEAYPAGGAVTNGLPAAAPTVYAAATSQPFAARGTLVQVLAPGPDGQPGPAGAARIFRLPAGTAAAVELGVTGSDGFLRGRGEIDRGDTLIALAPVAVSSEFTVYHTNFAPTEQGLDAQVVAEPGLQVLEVSPEKPFILFNLDVALEWDARNDGVFLDDLSASLRRSAEVLFDVTNGRMALGEVRIFQNKENWLAADAVIFAANNIRPRATMGGVVPEPRDDSVVTSTITTAGEVLTGTRSIPQAYQPGQIRMGPNWDPFGENRADLGQEWWRALAHEYGHYFLFLPDNYLGYDERGFIKPVDCFGSFMTTAYDETYSEFLTGAQWAEETRNCAETVAAYLTGRADWPTILHFYPELGVEPAVQEGPLQLPLPVTAVRFEPVAAPPVTLPVHNVDLRQAGGARLNLTDGQAYLFKTNEPEDPADDSLVALGSTSRRDFIKVRGAAPGDRLCVYDTSGEVSYRGCVEELQTLNRPIPVQTVTGWRPDVQVRPLIRPTLWVTVTRATEDAPTELTVVSSAETRPDVTLIVTPTATTPGELAISAPPMTFTFTYPATTTLPYRLVVFEPALVVTMTQAGLEQTPAVQIFPGYNFPGNQAPPRAPWRRLDPVAGAPGVFRQVIPLDYPFFAGFTRIWVPEAPEKEALSQFFLSPVWDADFRGGGGADFRGGGGADFRGGGGVDLRLGLYADFRGGGGADFRGGGGADFRGGGGVDLRPSLYADFRGGGGADFRGGGGVDLRPSLYADFRGGGGADFRGGGGALVRAWGANQRALGAPVASSDGQVTIFNTRDLLGETGTDTLEALIAVPNLPSWLTLVGQGYRFTSSADTPRTIAFNYLQRDVPAGYEHTLKLYYSPASASPPEWQRLEDTITDGNENLAVAPVRGDGLYALAATVDVPLTSRGWHLLSYPIPDERPVAEALQSIAGLYTTLYTYDGQSENPWKVYDVDLTASDPWVNDLEVLEFGRGYWINVREPVTIYFSIPPTPTVQTIRPATFVLTDLTPPAVFYGTLDRRLVPSTPGREVRIEARVFGALCGATTAERTPDGGMRYRIEVEAATPEVSACGVPRRSVIFWVNGIQTDSIFWDNARPVRLDLSP